MAYSSRQSNVFRSSQPNTRTPGPATGRRQNQKQMEHDLTLDSTDIIECLSELGILFSAEDLRRPMPLKVSYLFEAFASILMGVHKESIEPMIRAASQAHEYPEAQHESAMLMAFYRSLTQLMSECGVHNFSFNDILKPETDRLRFILSNVINFLRFRGERVELTENLIARSEQARLSIERLNIENDDLVRRIDNLKAQRKLEEPQIEQALQVNRNLTEDLRAYKKKQTALTNNYDKLKDERKSRTRTLQDCQYLIETKQRECNSLQPYIVDSPDQLQQVISDLTKSLAKEREAVDTAERQVRALQISADSFAVVEGDVSSCIKLMEDCQKELIRLEDCIRNLQRHKESLHQKQTDVKEIERKEERLVRTLKNAEEKLSRAREQAASRREATKREMERLQAEYTALSDERARADRDIEMKNSRIDIKHKEMADLKLNIESEIQAAKAEYDRLSSHIELYIGKMEQMMNAAT